MNWSGIRWIDTKYDPKAWHNEAEWCLYQYYHDENGDER